MFQGFPGGVGVADHSARDAYYGGVGRDGVDYYGAGAYFYVVADFDVA